MDLSHNSREAVILNHGYDESKPMEAFTIEDMQQAAAFRGGSVKPNSTNPKAKGLELWDTVLEWQSASGETFEATPRLILLGGHWAPGDMPFPYRFTEESERPWHWDEVAKSNPFFAQLWTPLHEPDENNVYGSEIFNGWEK